MFSKKKERIFSKITSKNNFWEHEGMGHWTTKRLYLTFSIGNGVPNTAFKFFSSETLYHLDLNPKKTGFGGTFSPISVVLLCQLFLKTTWVYPHQPC